MRVTGFQLSATAMLVLAVLFYYVPYSYADDIVVPRLSDWKYLDDGSNQGTAWIAPGFDDSSLGIWARGFGLWR